MIIIILKMNIIGRFFKSLTSCFKKSNTANYRRLDMSESLELGTCSKEYFSQLEEDDDEMIIHESIFESKISEASPKSIVKNLINEAAILSVK